MITLETPVVARLDGDRYPAIRGALAKSLTYTDKRVEFELRKVGKTLEKWETVAAFKMREHYGDAAYEARVADLRTKVADLESRRRICLLFEDARGLWTHSGLAHRIARAAKDTVQVAYSLPQPCPLAWETTPEHRDRPYQEEAFSKLLEASGSGPCGVELATGAGKSTVIRNIVRHLGLSTLVMAPSVSIARQLYDDLVKHLGKKVVGLYGDGKKEFDRLVVVGIDDSLSRVKQGSDAWASLSARKVFVADESHLCPADSLARVCFGLTATAPYRFFFSATQMRNDGLGLLLEGITGKIVMHKDVRELVDEGYLARPHFRMVRVRTDSAANSPDANVMTRKHLYYNKIVAKAAAQLADHFVADQKRPVLILVEEIEQYEQIAKHLKHEAWFANGLSRAEAGRRVPCVPGAQCGDGHMGGTCQNHAGLKPGDIVERFNLGQFPILIGTSCIATGTDIRVAEAAIYLQGGKSEIKVRQAVGRETRGGTKGTVVNLKTGARKVNCVHVDFDVVDVDRSAEENESFLPHKHASARARMYEKIYGPVRRVDMLRAT